MKKNEATVSSENTLYVAGLRGKLLRNNSGVYDPKNPPTPWSRWGLGNKSAKINKIYKSSDQIGVLPVVITQAMVGKTVGVFLAVEDKHSDWIFKGDEHENGQLNFINDMKRRHGIALFARCTDDIKNAITTYLKQLES